MTSQQLEYIVPDWPAPKNICAFTTTRLGGVSQGQYASLNLGLHVDDDPEAVAENRRLLIETLNIPNEPMWLNQVHGANVMNVVAEKLRDEGVDASYSTLPNQVCVIQTADCLPILLCTRNGTTVAAIHGGWRSLQQGIIANTVAAMQADPTTLLAWLGPAIGPEHFEVGPDVRALFMENDLSHSKAFTPGKNDRWLANIYLIARQQCQRLGINAITGGDLCTVSDPMRFYSYRRDGATGRQASLIWISADD